MTLKEILAERKKVARQKEMETARIDCNGQDDTQGQPQVQGEWLYNPWDDTENDFGGLF